MSSSLAGVRGSLSGFLLDAFDGVLGSESASPTARKESFISANMLAGAIGAAAWPLHWMFIGPADFSTVCVFLFMWAPLFIGLAVRMNWPLESGQAASAACLCGFVTSVSLLTGGVVSPALPWLLIVPMEAAVTGRGRAIVQSSVLAGAGFFLCASLSMLGWLPPSKLPTELVAFVFGGSIFTALIVGMLSLRALQRRFEQETSQLGRRLLFLHSVTAGAPDLITRHSAGGTVLYCSPSVEDLLGIHAAEFEGLSPAMFVHIQDLKLVELGLQRALSQGPQTIEFRLRRRDGSYVPVEMRAQFNDGEIIAISRDVSERNARIADLVIARDRADESSQAKLRFLASVTHELRTPLNAIIGFADMMHNEVFGSVGHVKYREYADHIRTSGLHLVDLVSDLLDMSKIEAGKFTIERQRVELRPLFDECIAMVSGVADDAGVNLQCETPRGLSVSADRRALKQALVNLLSNSIKFTLSEGAVVLSATGCADGVDIQVADTGVGIPSGDLERIGRPFEQVAGVRSLHKGTGLGLSLVKALTELHDGQMNIVSALGDGTTVTLHLPDVTADEADSDESKLVFPEKFRARA
ncbi:MAG: PAS domain-containing sensor histidine kinase [Micropepsaceae bacterium]